MRKLICLFFLIFSFFYLHAGKEVRLAAESEPLLTVADCVSLTDGSFFHVDQDLMVEGPVPLTFTRHYDSGYKDKELYHYNHHGYGVSLGYPLQIKYYTATGKTYVDQRHRFGIPFKLKNRDGRLRGYFHHKMYKWGYTNCTEALERGHASLAYTELCIKSKISPKNPKKWEWEWTVSDADGTQRIYAYFRSDAENYGCLQRYLLQRVDHPNGLSTHYLYDDTGHLGKVSLRNTLDQEELTSMNIHYGSYHYNLNGSNGTGIVYHEAAKKGQYTTGENQWTSYLTHICRRDLPEVNYGYTIPKERTHPFMNVISSPVNGRFLQVDYEKKGRVKCLRAPLDQTGTAQEMYTFKYDKKRVRVRNALGHLDTYHLSSKKRLKCKDEAGIRTYKYDWDDYGQLVSKDLRNSKQPEGFYGLISFVYEGIFFKYNEKGSISEKSEYGPITGDDAEFFLMMKRKIIGKPTCRKYKYEYGSYNTLVRKEDPNGLVTQYSYKPGTNLLISKLEGPHDAIHKREFYAYDKNAILIEHIEDDGSGSQRDDLTDVTYRRITRIQPQMDRSLFGLTKPAVEEKSYLDLATGQEILLKRTEMDYVAGGHLGEKRVYDAAGALAYKESCHYNINNILVKVWDRQGYATELCYDNNLNVSRIHLIGSGKQIHRTFDYSDRLIEEKEVHDDGTVLITTHTYDLVGNCTSTIDPQGFKTQFFYDPLNRKIKEIDPYGYTSIIEYDIKDNPISIRNKEGHTTYTKYNIDHHPTQIRFPDGTVEEFRYFVDGSLRSKKEKDGSSVEFTYDVFGRVLTESRLDQTGHLLTKKSNFYKGENLIAEIDPQGTVTTFTYDSAGRCLSTTREGITETYGYDSLNRRTTVQKGNKVTRQIFDVLDRVVEERVEGIDGEIYRKSLFSYDIHGNVCKKQVFTDENHAIETAILYNSSRLPILQIDGEGNQTTISYSHRPFQKFTTDPLGKMTIETYDAFKRIISTEVPGFSKQEVVYSPNGHRIKQIDHIYQQGVEKGLSTIFWKYDPMGNLLSLVEQYHKRTLYTYLYGRLDTTLKPDGVLLYYTYDALGKLVEQSSSDGNLWTQYSYDLNGNMLSAIDKVNDRSVIRTYDAHNNVTSESTHTALHYFYDELNRLIEIRLPDSSIHYTYNPADLVSISRSGKTHAYVYDLAGRLIQEDTFDGTTTFYTHNDNHHLVSIVSPFYNQRFIYDAVDNIVSSSLNGQITTYTYDGLYQLLSEHSTTYNNHSIYQILAENYTTYTYDSLYNRLSKDNDNYQHNTFHQVLSDDVNIYTYDLNGNRLTKNGIVYTYDPLNRLTSAGEIIYNYDALGRLQSRVSTTSEESFVYYRETELGSLDNLKIIGKGIVALEQNGQLYSVVCDHRGSPSLIFSNAYPIATYTYTAFGEATHTGTVHSPWQYSGHRCDADTQLLHAPKRVYDPHLGRWLTPDPLGFADGPNLYAYVHNNPLIFIDPTGLSKEHARRTYGRYGTVLTFSSGIERSSASSHYYKLSVNEFRDLEKGFISFINGINTPLNASKDHSRHIGRIAGGYNVHGIYNATHGPIFDAIEYFINRFYIDTPPVRELQKQWNQFFARADKNAALLQICHSHGAVLVRNALMNYPEELRNRIIVVAIAPGAYIDRNLCRKVTHYVTNGDLVTWLDPRGRSRCRKDVVVLKSLTMTGFMDHDFQSKTYKKSLSYETEDYIKQYER